MQGLILCARCTVVLDTLSCQPLKGLRLRQKDLKALAGSCSSNVVPMQVFVVSRLYRKSHFCCYGKCHCC